MKVPTLQASDFLGHVRTDIFLYTETHVQVEPWFKSMKKVIFISRGCAGRRYWKFYNGQVYRLEHIRVAHNAKTSQ